MIITTITRVTFDPVKEYKAMRDFEAESPNWMKSESTVGVTFSLEQSVSYEVKDNL